MKHKEHITNGEECWCEPKVIKVVGKLDMAESKAFIRPDGAAETYAVQIEKLAQKINELIESSL